MVPYSEFLQYFTKLLEEDATIQRLWSKANSGEATFEDARAYSNNVIMKWNLANRGNLGASISVSSEEWAEMRDELERLYSETAQYSKAVCAGVTKGAGLGVKTIKPRIDEERLENLYKRVESLAEEKPEAILGEAITNQVIDNISKVAIADTVHANARIQSGLGIHAYIARHSAAGCCAWCDSVSGTFEYGSQPDDFFKVHPDCTCIFEYRPSKTAIMRYSYNTEWTTDKEGKKKAILTKEDV